MQARAHGRAAAPPRWWAATLGQVLPVLLLSLPAPARAATPVGGPIDVDTVWRAEQSPFDVTGDVAVRNGATLTIEAGVTLYMRSGTNLIVEQGALRALGTAAAPVVITSPRDQGTDTPAPGDWGQLRFLDGTLDTATLLQYTQIRYGKGLVVESASPTLNNVTIAGHAGPAIAVDLRASPTGTGNRALGNTLDGIQVPPGDILGSVNWSLQGVPYVVTGTLGIGAPPVISAIEPATIEQGAAVDGVMRGTRLSGAESLTFDGTGVTAVVRDGGTDTQVPVTIAAAPAAALGARGALAQVAAGQIRLDGALSVLFPLPPIQLTGVVPTSIRAGETRAFAVSGAQLLGATLTMSNSALTASSYATTDNQATFSLTAAAGAATGTAVLTFANPGAAKGTASVNVTVRPPLPRIVVTPSVLALPASPGARSFHIALSNADDEDHVLNLTVGNSALVSVAPLSFVMRAGETQAVVSITGLANGQTSLSAASTGLASVDVPVLVTPEFDSINSTNASVVGVNRTATTAAQTRQAGPLAAALVGVAAGRFISDVAPRSLAVGSGPTTLTITGSGLDGVTGVSILPATGLTLGVYSVSADGRTVTLPVTVAPDAPATVRQVVLTGAQQPYAAARPDADRLLITLAPPTIESVEPVLVSQGATAVALTIRGRNLQGVQSILALPGEGLFIGTSPGVSADGTTLTTLISVAADATPGNRIIQVATAGGASSGLSSPANSLRVLAQGVPVTPVPSLTGLNVGVARDAAVAAQTRPAQVVAPAVSVTVGPAVTARTPASGVIGETVTLALAGVELQGVTQVEFSPPDGVAVGAPSVAADGRSATVSVQIASNAPQTLRGLAVRAGAVLLPFTDPSQANFRVTPPVPRVDSVTPNTLQIGAGTAPLVVRGVNFQNATEVRFVPANGVTVSVPPAVGAGGTEATVNVTVAAGAAAGPRAVVLVTPAGQTDSIPTPANTVVLANTLSDPVTPVTAPSVGVARDAPGGAAPLTIDRVPSAPVGVAVGTVAFGIQAPTLNPLTSGVLRIAGVGLGEVTEVRLVGADGVSIGPGFQVSPDGHELTVTINVDGNPVGGPRQLELLGANGRRIFFADASTGFVTILTGTQYFLPGATVGVTRDAPASTATRPASLASAQVGVVVGSLAVTLDAPPLYPGAAGVLTIGGRGLDGVTGVSFTGAAGLSAGPPQVNADGTLLTVSVSVAAGSAAGVRGVVLNSGSGPVPFADPRVAQVAVATGVPSIDSIEPIVWSQGQNFTLTVRGQNLGLAQAVLASPPQGMTFDSLISVSADGTTLTVKVAVAPDAPPTEEGLIQVVTPGGTTPAVRSPANGFRLVH